LFCTSIFCKFYKKVSRKIIHVQKYSVREERKYSISDLFFARTVQKTMMQRQCVCTLRERVTPGFVFEEHRARLYAATFVCRRLTKLGFFSSCDTKDFSRIRSCPTKRIRQVCVVRVHIYAIYIKVQSHSNGNSIWCLVFHRTLYLLQQLVHLKLYTTCTGGGGKYN